MDEKVSETDRKPVSKHKAPTDSSTEIELAVIPYRTEDIFGYGINCVTGRASTVLCVKNVNKHTVDDNHSHVHLTVIRDSRSFSNFVSATVSVDASGLSWSTSGSVSYAVTQTGSDTYMSYVAFNQLRTQRIYLNITEATITEEALALITSDPVSGPAKFLAKYGTHCVIGVAYGASFVGRLRFEAHTASDKESIATTMSASANAFGVSGSVDAEFNSERSRISASYSFSSDAYLDGGTVNGSRTDPDGIVACANSLAPIGRGNAIGFRCVTWDQFPQIQAALNSINQPQALSLANAAGNLAQLSNEYAALDYVMSTCGSMIQSGVYAIPSYGGTLGRMLQGASTGQTAIQTLTVEQIGQLTPQQLARYLISAQMRPLLNAISHNQVLVQASWYLDDAFTTPGSFSKPCTVAFPSDLYRVIEVVHYGFEHPAALYFHAGQDGQGSYLVARWDWEYEQHWDGARVDIGTSSFPTGVSRAEWQGANWNNIQAQLVDFNPATLYGRV
jgi:hypothetical protein